MCENTLDYYCTTVAAKVRSTFNDLVARMPVCCIVVSSVFIPNPFCAIKKHKNSRTCQKCQKYEL